MTLSDLKRRDAKGHTFPEDLRNICSNQMCGVHIYEEGANFHGSHTPRLNRIGGPSGTNFGKTLPTPTRSDLERPKVGINICEEGACFYGSATPQFAVWAPASQRFWTYKHMRNSNQIMHGNQSRCKETFTRSTAPRGLDKNFGDMNADARSFCGS